MSYRLASMIEESFDSIEYKFLYGEFPTHIDHHLAVQFRSIALIYFNHCFNKMWIEETEYLDHLVCHLPSVFNARRLDFL
jgi:hypothetical protein